MLSWLLKALQDLTPACFSRIILYLSFPRPYALFTLATFQFFVTLASFSHPSFCIWFPLPRRLPLTYSLPGWPFSSSDLNYYGLAYYIHGEAFWDLWVPIIFLTLYHLLLELITICNYIFVYLLIFCYPLLSLSPPSFLAPSYFLVLLSGQDLVFSGPQYTSSLSSAPGVWWRVSIYLLNEWITMDEGMQWHIYL